MLKSFIKIITSYYSIYIIHIRLTTTVGHIRKELPSSYNLFSFKTVNVGIVRTFILGTLVIFLQLYIFGTFIIIVHLGIKQFWNYGKSYKM